ncbi:hypothetical protein DFR70_12017 [Nocardia tenerifensis]|uniref:L-tyrosine 3-hydroxylase n=1 Tax=Nocardia tenerifensis TaxID=228006 RepID=A0A318JUG7_9NOCA|nr:hypothetical protein [Nocardia tenerifensis]PXX56276.1 hypothetical protein DFR70_12017 [Nocardia tenerifensis]
MTTEAIVIDLPVTSGWYFGGVRYGLEPLTLPNPEVADDDLPAGREHADYRDVGARILDGDMVAGDESEQEIFWFRWLTGHQVSFVIWRLMAGVLRDMDAGRTPPSIGCRELTDYLRGYCAMLLYTSSCPRQVYQSLIRPSMYLQHRCFSGGWAPDYRPVRDVFRGRLPSGTEYLREAADLATAVRLYQEIHEGVAAKLVPDGPSLLRAAASAGRARGIRLQDTRLLGLLYDNYFLTMRAQVSRQDIVAQLARRLVAISQDVASNGLSLVDGQPTVELSSAEVLACAKRLPQINFRVVSHAVGNRLPRLDSLTAQAPLPGEHRGLRAQGG